MQLYSPDPGNSLPHIEPLDGRVLFAHHAVAAYHAGAYQDGVCANFNGFAANGSAVASSGEIVSGNARTLWKTLQSLETPYLRVFHHNLSIQAAAYQNGIWVVATAKAGKEDGFWLHGGSAIVAPTGEIVAKSTTEEDEVISYDCDMALGEYIRNTTFNFAKHRRPEHYKLISERTGVKVEPAN